MRDVLHKPTAQVLQLSQHQGPLFKLRALRAEVIALRGDLQFLRANALALSEHLAGLASPQRSPAAAPSAAPAAAHDCPAQPASAAPGFACVGGGSC
jgi:hypothetical protein